MKRQLLICSLAFVFFSCQKDYFTITNLNGGKITVLGHAGMGIGNTYPMNSYESILKCLNTGAQGSEMDVQLTKDSVLVAYHSRDLSDNTNLSGIVHAFTWAELKSAYYTSTPYLRYSILSLDELFSNIENLHDYVFTFDCKLYTQENATTYKKTYINSIAKIIDRYDLADNVYLESQDTDFLPRLKQKNQSFKLFIYPSSYDNGLSKALDLGLYGITISTDDITKEQVEEAHRNNLHIALWNTHSKRRNKEAIDKSPDFIQTDRVAHLVKMLE